MTTRKNVSLRELGWNLSYDIDGKYPLIEHEHVPISPNEVITLYLRNRPVQEEDGIFYGTAVESSVKFPLFFFNMCRKKDKLNIFYLFGTEDVFYPSLKGKIESFSLWGKALEDTSLIEYHTNTMKMIGNGAEYNYQTEQEAIDDDLKMHYEFSQASTIVPNFDGGINAVKNRMFDIVGGQTVSASGLTQREDLVFIELANFYSDFTMNFRFYVEEMDDFTLFHSKDIGFIRYDVTTGTFEAELFPHIGNARTSHIQHENLKVHTWYDFAIKYDRGEITSVLKGEVLEKENLGLDVGGVYSILADTSNFSSIAVDSTYTFKSSWHEREKYPETFAGEEQPSSDFTFSHGRDEFYTMTIGKNRDLTPAIVLASNIREYNIATIDALNDDYKYNIYISGANTPTRVNFIVEKFGGDGLRFQVARINSYSYVYTGNNNRAWTSALVPQGYVKITLTVKDILESNDPVFPVVFLLPGLPISIHKVKMDEDNKIDFNAVSSESANCDIEWHFKGVNSYYEYYDIMQNKHDMVLARFYRYSTAGYHELQLKKGESYDIGNSLGFRDPNTVTTGHAKMIGCESKQEAYRFEGMISFMNIGFK